MRLPFEEWTIQKKFKKNVSKLFDEAFICYKNNAYRASLLFSYLSFLTILKEIILNSVKPSVIQQSRWDSLVKKLQNDDTWEKAVFEELVNSSSPIFNITEDLRQQIKYWKDRRNDCAHFKTNEIESHHTETFWSFLKSNLSKITIEGGKETLLNKLEKHYDPTFTPLDADVTYLIKEIDDSVSTAELSDFWSELLSRIDLFGFTYNYETIATRIINQVFSLCSELTKENLSTFLKHNKHDLVIVSIYPDKINFLNYTPSEIREIWRTRILPHKSSAFIIYGALLRNSLIPSTEIKEANKYIIDNITEYRPHDEATHLALSINGFGDQLFEIAIHNNRLKDWYQWVNPRADMIAYYIEKYPLKDETVEVICEMLTRDKYSFWLEERIVRIFSENAQKKNEFSLIANRCAFIIPSKLH